MKVILSTLDQRALPEARGQYQVVQYRGGLIVKKWPKKRGKSNTPGDWYHRQEFGKIARWVSSPHPLDYNTAVEFAKGTEQIPRDILMMAAYGIYFDIYLPDGTLAPKYRDIVTNAQFTLDQVTEESGSLMYRSPYGWIGIPPGNAGEVLTMVDQAPAWDTPSIGGSGGAPSSIAGVADGVNGSGEAAKGMCFYPRVAFQMTRLESYVDTISGASYKMQVWTFSGSSLIEKLYESPTIEGPATGTLSFNHELASVVNIDAGSAIAVLWIRTDATDSTSCGIQISTDVSYGIPCRARANRGYVEKRDPQPGNTIVRSSNGSPFCFFVEGAIDWA